MLKRFILIMCITCNALLADSFGYINLGVSSLRPTKNLPSGAVYNFEYGGTKVWDNGVLAGADVFFYYGKPEGENVGAMGASFKLGYSYKELRTFALFSGVQNDYRHLSSAGFGWGAGMEYPLFKKLGIGMQYLNYNLITDTPLTYQLSIFKGYVQVDIY